VYDNHLKNHEMDQPKIERLLQLMMLLTANSRYTVNGIAVLPLRDARRHRRLRFLPSDASLRVGRSSGMKFFLKKSFISTSIPSIAGAGSGSRKSVPLWTGRW
jgi:hypothetical protein